MTEQQSGTGVTSPEAVLERIMERNAEIQKIRRKQSAVSIAGVLLILVFLLFFVLNLKNFGEKTRIFSIISVLEQISRILKENPEKK